MSTSDQQHQGPLTRKQLREIRLTGSTPVITAEDVAAAAAQPAPPAAPQPRPEETEDAAPAEPAADSGDGGPAPLTRRQVRRRERVEAAPVPVPGEEQTDSFEDAGQERVEELVVVDESAPASVEQPIGAADAGDDDDLDEVIVSVPVSASTAADSVGDVPLGQDSALVAEDAPVREDAPDHDAVAALGLDSEAHETGDEERGEDDVLADVEDADEEVVPEGERPTVNPAFGNGLLNNAEEAPKPFAPSFDELLTVGDSTGSQHLAPNALIFTQSPGEGSLSGPVASTGEVLVTGSYELPQGMGSQGHAHGTTDGREVDAVLIDGELPPASSPTPIAASSAVSTIKPAGEVIRPPAPEKGSKLMLTLAITAGGLALALAVVLVVAFTTNVF